MPLDWFYLVKSCITVGKFGELVFPAGDYMYLGSAMGPGGLFARLSHHLRVASKPHWHIDWLRQYAALPEIWYTTYLETPRVCMEPGTH